MFPASYATALADFIAATPQRPLAVRSLRVLGGEEQQLELAFALWNIGFACVVPKPAAQQEGGKEKGGKDKGGKKGGEEKKGAEGKKGGEGAKKEGQSPPAKKAKKGK